MKSMLNWKICTFACLFFLFATGYVHAQEDQVCSNATFKGAYGVTLQGTEDAFEVNPPLPFSFVGRFVADGQGNILNGNATTVIAGFVQRGRTFSGTYTVNQDCTGSGTINLVGGGEETTFDFVLMDEGNEMILVITNTDGDQDTGTVKRIVRK